MNFFSRNKKRILSTLILAALLVSSAMAETMLVTEKARAYQLPSTSAKFFNVGAGTTVEKIAEQNGWVRVERAGKTAYMRANCVTEVTEYGGAAGYVSKAAPMYKAYGKSAKHGTLPVGAEVSVYSTAGEWAYVGYKNYKGFVSKACLSTSKPEIPEVQAPETENNEVVITKGKSAYVSVEGAKVYKTYSTSSKVLGSLPVNTKLSVGAVSGDWAFVGLNGFYGFIKIANLSNEKLPEVSAPVTNPSEDAADDGDKVSTAVPESADLGKSSTAPARGTAKEMDWWTSDIQQIFARGTTATITDVATGIAWKEMRKGGTNHADVQPLTAADTAAMKAAVGKWSWDRRAIFVTINGVNYAASMNCQPHGAGSITNNNFNGHHCIYFTNSRGHSSNKICNLHQAAIKKALAAKL